LLSNHSGLAASYSGLTPRSIHSFLSARLGWQQATPG
jgi:hypothetical protein